MTPHFAVLDERGQALLRKAAFDFVIARAAEDKRRRARASARAPSSRMASEFYFRKVIDAVLAKRAEMERMIAYHDGRADWAEAECARRSSTCSAWRRPTSKR